MTAIVSQEKALEIFQRKARANAARTSQNIDNLHHITSNTNDFIVSDHKNHLFTFQTPNLTQQPELVFMHNDNDYLFHQNALQQYCSKVGFPMDYYNRIVGTSWGRDIAHNAFNQHLAHFPKERSLIRSVTRPDGKEEVRGFLSDKYKRLETGQIFGSLLTAMQKVDSRSFIFDAYVSDTRSWIDIMLPELFHMTTENNGTVYFVMGVRMSSSDFGDGAFQIQTYMLNIVCSNGMTRTTAMREVHLGAKLPENISFSDRTHLLETKLTSSKVSDICSQSFSTEVVREQLDSLYESTNIKIDPKNELSKIKDFSKEEKKLIEDELIANEPEHGVEGQNTVWKLSQAMTFVGQSLGERRQREIEEIAGNFLNSKTTKNG
jgi:hypothetical protein